jgi:tetratricopeptide (TPR) repeat protein
MATATIWASRLSAYNGEYKNTIALLTDNIKPDYTSQEMARFLRHRGHRYITLREFELAKVDFQTAAMLMAESDDRVEEDGLPNSMNQPLSSLYTNVWYHLGLAYYLTSDFEGAIRAYEECFDASTNDDMRVAALYWHYMSLRKLGRDDAAGRLLDQVSPDLTIIENDSYLNLLLVFKGEFDADHLLNGDGDQLTNATVGYGIGFWHDINGRHDRANQIWQDVYDAGNWTAFGYIASEVELASNN